MEISIQLKELHPAQKRVMEEKKRFNVVCCGRRWGKSELAVDLLTTTALDGGNPVGYFTPTYKLLDGTYKQALRILEPLIQRSHEHQFIELAGGGVIDFWSLDNPLSGRSRKYKLAILDEAAFTPNLWEAWTESIRPTLTDLKGDAWFLSTPKGKNDFYKLFLRGRADEGWMSWQMPTSSNPFIDKMEIDDARADLPEAAFNQEYLAQFLDNASNPFGTSYITQCVYPMSQQPAVCYGIDLAKSFDYTVIIGLDRHGSVCHFDRFQADWRQTTQKIMSLPMVPIAIDSTGVGDPIGEALAIMREVELFRFTSLSKQQLMEGLAKAIQERRICFPEGIIVDELNSFEYEFTRTGVKYSAPAGMHDDCVMALGLALHKHKTAATYGEISVW